MTQVLKIDLLQIGRVSCVDGKCVGISAGLLLGTNQTHYAKRPSSR